MTKPAAAKHRQILKNT